MFVEINLCSKYTEENFGHFLSFKKIFYQMPFNQSNHSNFWIVLALSTYTISVNFTLFPQGNKIFIGMLFVKRALPGKYNVCGLLAYYVFCQWWAMFRLSDANSLITVNTNNTAGWFHRYSNDFKNNFL